MADRNKFDESKMICNPFSFGLKIPVTRITDGNKYRLSEGVMVNAEFEIDRRESVKMYYCAGLRDLVYGLSAPAKSMLLYIMLHLDANVDYIKLNKGHFMRVHGINSVNTYKKAIAELVRYCFIAQSGDFDNVYWINPAYFFNGNPVRKYPANCVVKAELSK